MLRRFEGGGNSAAAKIDADRSRFTRGYLGTLIGAIGCELGWLGCQVDLRVELVLKLF
jgi:hypothetical protein